MCGATERCCNGTCIGRGLNTDCGACGNNCGANAQCRGVAADTFRCECQAPFENCDGNFNTNGCETNTNTNQNNCGGCGRLCRPANASPACRGGSCQVASCNANFGNCDGGQGNGCETRFGSLANCQSCGDTCLDRANSSPLCGGGGCSFSCNGGFDDCDGTVSNGCETRLGTLSNCAFCSDVCLDRANSSPVCSSGSCGIVCDAGFDNCDGGLGNGCEAMLGTVAHCARCGDSCSAPTNGSAVCSIGSCGIACNSGFHECSGACLSNTSPASCGTRCTTCPAEANATAGCDGTSCTYTCEAGFADCNGDLGTGGNGCEADLSSTTNCGACGATCDAGHSCDGGACCCGATCGAVGTGNEGCGIGEMCCPNDTCAVVCL